jgi:hypothetical protein
LHWAALVCNPISDGFVEKLLKRFPRYCHRKCSAVQCSAVQCSAVQVLQVLEMSQLHFRICCMTEQNKVIKV